MSSKAVIEDKRWDRKKFYIFYYVKDEGIRVLKFFLKLMKKKVLVCKFLGLRVSGVRILVNKTLEPDTDPDSNF